MPPMLGQGQSPSGDMAGSAGAPASGSDGQRQALEAAIQKIRDIGKSVDDLAGSMPSMAQEAQKIKQVLRTMITKAASQAPQQTKSATDLPGGGG